MTGATQPAAAEAPQTTPPRSWRDENAILYAALAGVCVAGAYEIFGRDQHGWADRWAVCCYAVAVPFLVLRFLMIRLELPTTTRWVRRFCVLFDLVGVGGTVVGFSCVLGSFFEPATVLFLAGLLLAPLLYLLACRLDAKDSTTGGSP